MSEDNWFERAREELAADADADADADAESEGDGDPDPDEYAEASTDTTTDSDSINNGQTRPTAGPTDGEPDGDTATEPSRESRQTDATVANTETGPDDAAATETGSTGRTQVEPGSDGRTVTEPGSSDVSVTESHHPGSAGRNSDARSGSRDPASHEGDSISRNGVSRGTDKEQVHDDTGASEESEGVALGIDGLDAMVHSGVPPNSVITTIGAAGTGKSTFAIEFLGYTLAGGNCGVYITLEESREAILATAEGLGRPFREYEQAGHLVIVSIDPAEMANSLASIRNELTEIIGASDVERVVLDSVSLLEMIYDSPAERRSEVLDFTQSLKEAGVTTLLTSEASPENAYASRHGLVEYHSDAVFVQQYVRSPEFQETRLAIEIQKIRGAGHSRETNPYEITDEGLSVHRQTDTT